MAVIAFGMNDGSIGRSAEEFRANILSIMQSARESNADCEFILVSTTLANPDSRYEGKHREYYDILAECVGEYDAVADMTTIHSDLIKKKKFQDMTANNINHPNDYLVRIYAQIIIEIIDTI